MVVVGLGTDVGVVDEGLRVEVVFAGEELVAPQPESARIVKNVAR